jgi:hypothetical protein
MEKPLLNDSEIFPDDSVLESVLGKAFPAYSSLISAFSGNEIGLVPEWRYYKDGGAWLCKVQYKKKTVFWLSVWDNYFKTGFYFTERHLAGIGELPIDSALKEQIATAKPFGKLFPLSLTFHVAKPRNDLKQIVEYKKKLK